MSSLARRPSRTSVSAQLLHDLRSPLSQIIGYSEMLSEDAEAKTSQSLVTDLDRIRTAGQRVLALIEENFSGSLEASLAGRAPCEAGPEDKTLTRYTRDEVEPGRLFVVDDEASNREDR